MKLHCRLIPEDEKMRTSLSTRLEALGHKPTIDSEGAVVVDYDGPCSGEPLAIITVFESYGCDHAILWKGETESGKETTSVRVRLGGKG